MSKVTHINPEALHTNPAYTQAVRINAGLDLVLVGGQNGVDSSGSVVGTDLASQARQAMANLEQCLAAAGAGLSEVVKWNVLLRDDASLEEGFAAFLEAWGNRPNPPVITVALVSGLAVPDALVEIEALAAVDPGS